jgi:NAD(P)-dependent dehydrogenase (short-subunit alcohol dehydrogenase family)
MNYRRQIQKRISAGLPKPRITIFSASFIGTLLHSLNASVNGHIGMPNTTVYGASKAALLSLTRTLSGELISRGIRVNAVSPGPIATPLYSKLGLEEADLKAVSASIQSQVPAGRFGSSGEIDHAIVFLASDESAFTVGSEIMIDGGMGNL